MNKRDARYSESLKTIQSLIESSARSHLELNVCLLKGKYEDESIALLLEFEHLLSRAAKIANELLLDAKIARAIQERAEDAME